MRVEIVDISNISAWYEDKEDLIGLKGTLATGNTWNKEFISGRFYADIPLHTGDDEPYFFYGVKTKPIFDA